jgi:hypothetical protein
MVDWNHDALAADLARRLRTDGKQWTWLDIAIGAWSGARPDVMAFPRWRYDVPQIHAYEIKVGRGDLLSDLNSGKWRKYLEHCQSVTFAMPHGLATKDEIPGECGVMFRTGRGWRTERRPTNMGSACSIQAMAKLLTCHPTREPYPGLPRHMQDSEARHCIDNFRREAGQKLGHALARLAADVAEGKDPAERAREQADTIIAAAQAEAVRARSALEPILVALGIPADVSEWEVARRIREAAANLHADTRVAKVEAALDKARKALDDVVLLAAREA